MDNKMVYGLVTLLFNQLGIPCFMRGDTKTGIIRIVLCFVTCGIVGFINGIMGLILGIKILTMSDEDFAAQKDTLITGIPKGN